MSARRAYLIAEAVKTLHANLALALGKRTERHERPVAKAFLLAGSYFYEGALWEPKVKHVGLGVYDCSVTEK